MEHTYALTPLTQAFVDFHDNGRIPPRGRTRYGLVVDINRSSERLNINFEVMTDEQFVMLLDNPNIGDDGKAVITKALERYIEIGGWDSRNAYIAHAKRNIHSGKRDQQGKPTYKLVPDYTVCAIIIADEADDPDVMLFYGNDTKLLKSEGWYVPSTTNDTIKARIDLR